MSRVGDLEFSAIVPTLKPDIGIANDLRQVGSRIANDRAVIGCLEGIGVIDTVIHKPKTWILDIRATKSVVSASVAPIDRKPTDTLLVATRASEKAGKFHRSNQEEYLVEFVFGYCGRKPGIEDDWCGSYPHRSVIVNDGSFWMHGYR